jgi:hypothetical protein
MPLVGVLLAMLVILGVASRASAGEPPGPVTTPPTTSPAQAKFPWTDNVRKEAFRTCVDWVDKTARTEDIPDGVYWDSDGPDGVSGDEWNTAIDDGHFLPLRAQDFSWRPKCHVFLPGNWEDLVPERFRSEVYRRCRAITDPEVGNADGPELDTQSTDRPKVVPAWYWFLSIKIDECWPLLPRGAFDVGPDTNDWSSWTTELEVDYPTTNQDLKVQEEYQQCLAYLEWRMKEGQASFGGTGSVYDDPKNGKTPKNLWAEAIDFYQNPNAFIKHPTGIDEWSPDCEKILVIEACRPTSADNPGLLPEECVGTHPIRNFDINYSGTDDDDEDDGSPSITRNLWGGSTNFAFYLAKGATQISLWAVHWAYTFDIRKYDVLAITMGDNFQNNLLGHPGFRLKELCWLLLFSWAGFMALRGKLATAGAELLTTMVGLLLSAVLIGNRQLYMDAIWNLMDEASTTVLVAGMGGDPSQPTTREELVREIQKKIQIIFIEDPYDYLNWGRPLGESLDTTNPLRACAGARYYILSRGPHGTDPLPRKEMTAAGPECKALVDFNRDPDGNRLLGAVLVMISAWTAGGLMITMGLTIVVGKITALLMFGLVPFVGVLVILPAQGRRIAWSVVLAMGKAVVVVVGIGGALSITMLSLTSVADVTESVSMIERFAMMNLVIAIAFTMRRKVIASGEIFTARMREYMSTARGSGHDWASATQGVGGDGDTPLMAADRYLGLGAGYAVGGSAAMASRFAIKRTTEGRVARRSYKNLQKVAYWKRRKNLGPFSRGPLP